MSINFFAATLLLGGASAFALSGRILEAAGRKPVPGALITVQETGSSARSDSAGRFTLDPTATFRASGNPEGYRFSLEHGHVELSVGRSGLFPSVALIGLAGASHPVGLATLGPGAFRLRFDPDAGWPEGEQRVLRVQVGEHRSFHLLMRLPGAGFRLSSASRGGPSGGLAKRAPGRIKVTVPKLKDTVVAFAANDGNLGDIVLQYPPRVLDVGSQAPYGAVVYFDGTQSMRDANWQMWPRATQAFTWKIMPDPVNSAGSALNPSGTTFQSCCVKGFGQEDIVTKETFTDFQAHVEFLLLGPYESGDTGYCNSGVYLQNRYEVQINTGYGGNHGIGGIVGEVGPLTNAWRDNGKWQAYDITFRAARWNGTTRTEKARVTVYWNGKLIHDNLEIAYIRGGANNDKEDPSPQGLKLQNEGTDVRYRNTWIKKLDIPAPQTNFGY